MDKLNLQVFVVPLGASMRRQFCEKLQKLPYDAGVLLLPTGMLQEQTRSEYNISCSSFDTLANKLLNLNGYTAFDEINYRSQQLLVQEVLEYFAEQGSLKYFAEAVDKKGFVRNMTSLLGQLSRSGASAEEIVNALAAWGRKDNAGLKDKEIALIYTGYRSLLQERKRYDLEGKYRLALRILTGNKRVKLPWQEIYISDFADFDALQLELLIELARHCRVVMGMSYAKEQSCTRFSEGALSRLEQEVKLTYVEGTAPLRAQSLQTLVDNITRDGVVSESLQDEAVLIREYKSREDELAGVLSEVKQSVLQGAELSDFVVAVRDLRNYAGIRALADSCGIPLCLAKTAPLLAQPLAELLALLLEAVPDNRRGAEAYFSLLDCPLTKLLCERSLEDMESLRGEIYFKKRSEAQSRVLGKLGEDVPAFLESLNSFILACEPQNTITGYTERLGGFLESLALPRILGDLYIRGELGLQGMQNLLASGKALQETMEQLRTDYEQCGLGERSYSLAEFLLLWQETLQEAAILLEKSSTHGLMVTDVLQLQGSSFKYVYILGLREGEFPSGNRENWLYNDKERGELKSLGVDLPGTPAAYAGEGCFFAGALAAATEKLVLSFYKDDEGEASPYIDDVRAIFSNLSITEFPEKTAASVAEVLRRSNACADEWLTAKIGAETLIAAQTDKERAGVYNGVMQDEELVKALKAKTRHSFSASALSAYVECPFKFLAARLWEQEEFAERAENMDGGTRGSILHDTLSRFVARYLNGKPSDDINALRELLYADYDTVVAEYITNGDIYDNEFWEVDSLRLRHILDWWLEFEVEEQRQWVDFKPMALECDFGRAGTEVELTTTAGEKVLLKGRVDRVDANDNAVFVTDYKSGAAPNSKEFEENRDLQMSVYLLAAEKLFKGKAVWGGGYLAFKERSRKGGVVWSHTGNANIKLNGKKNAPLFKDWSEVKSVCESTILEPVEQIYRGNFAVAPQDADACTYCGLADICRKGILAKSAVTTDDVEER